MERSNLLAKMAYQCAMNKTIVVVNDNSSVLPISNTLNLSSSSPLNDTPIDTSDLSPNSSILTENIASLNPFRFSSEYHDSALGLVYYNYRHYNPNDGRWINREPIAEKGGYNLYEIVKNNLLNHIDRLGYIEEIFDQTFLVQEGTYFYYIGSNRTSTGWVNMYEERPFMRKINVKMKNERSCINKGTSPVINLTEAATINVLGTPDQYGISLFVVGINFSWNLKVRSKTESKSCQLGYNGSILKVTYYFDVYKRYSAGITPGLGPVSIDIGISLGYNERYKTFITTITQKCCCKNP